MAPSLLTRRAFARLSHTLGATVTHTGGTLLAEPLLTLSQGAQVVHGTLAVVRTACGGSP